MDLGGRVAIVTGSGKGMGPAIVETLAREGADLMLCGRELAPLERLSERVRKLGRRVFITSCDVCKPTEVHAMVTETLRQLGGRIDILVNAAGATGPVERSTIDTTPDEFDGVVAVNMRGVYLTIRAVLPTMMAQQYGKIVNVGGTWGLRGRALRMAYSATKWGLRGITKSVALEAGPDNIHLNDVCPRHVGRARRGNTLPVETQPSRKNHHAECQGSAAA